ncbi:activator of HSP90 ATPase [Youhaiella tibetensis]|jgi:uncharacterized protein YndB with AHSA1/START domain|uniref:ATPase n=1 Tax=Paradevosia tibetensis TaxID=1447062 RepID=A0A5B9DK66_9HYPH|nr:SRPBCC domain-containing protein [Youhaiella tibetensis]AKR58386.1 ATPase [Devosia sp. H5989]QEE19252.1 ATPase [Youhaiella tibetensis]GGF34836.1 activator of HSP90 ATPase [Youhaiella tibetensis]
MNEAVSHTTFTIARDLPGSPRHAFRFWSEAELKRQWNSCHVDWTELDGRFDFRRGGEEMALWRMPDARKLGFRAHYFEIVPAARIVYAYEMTLEGASISTSLVTIEFRARGKETRMTFTEQAAFLDGSDPATRKLGTEDGFERLIAVMELDGAVQH